MARHASIAARIAAAAGLLFLLAACSAVPTLRFDDEVDDAAARTGPCVPTGDEICDDGVDNDCNGKVDCADARCTERYACAEAAPDDWQLVALADATRPSCPAGFAEAHDVRAVRGSSGAADCGCDCGGAAACAPAGVLARVDNDSRCEAAATTFQVRTQCTRMGGGGIAVGGNAFTRATAGAASSCNQAPAGTVAPVKDGRTCGVSKLGGGCTNGQVCVAKPSKAFDLCVTKAGSVACPGAFPISHRTGTDANDSRECTKCTCTAVPCTGEVKLYDSKDCSGSETMTLAATPPPGACTPMTNGAFQARGYVATVTGGCATKTAAQGSGALALTNEATVCCK